MGLFIQLADLFLEVDHAVLAHTVSTIQRRHRIQNAGQAAVLRLGLRLGRPGGPFPARAPSILGVPDSDDHAVPVHCPRYGLATVGTVPHTGHGAPTSEGAAAEAGGKARPVRDHLCVLRVPRLRVYRHLAGGQPPLRGACGSQPVSLPHTTAIDGGLLRGEPSGLQRFLLKKTSVA